MKKLSLLMIASLLSILSFAQVGIGNNSPRGLLDISNSPDREDTMGLVLPSSSDVYQMKNPVTGLPTIVSGTIAYDTRRECVTAFIIDKWYCLSMDQDTPTPTLPSIDCSSFSKQGTYVASIPFTSGNTISYTVKNENNRSATFNLSNALSVTSSISDNINVSSSENYSSVTLSAGQSKTLSYKLTGTPSAASTLNVNFAIDEGDSCANTITISDIPTSIDLSMNIACSSQDIVTPISGAIPILAWNNDMIQKFKNGSGIMTLEEFMNELVPMQGKHPSLYNESGTKIAGCTTRVSGYMPFEVYTLKVNYTDGTSTEAQIMDTCQNGSWNHIRGEGSLDAIYNSNKQIKNIERVSVRGHSVSTDFTDASGVLGKSIHTITGTFTDRGNSAPFNLIDTADGSVIATVNSSPFSIELLNQTTNETRDFKLQSQSDATNTSNTVSLFFENCSSN